ncbi:hydantoinase/oxoprolinase family protein [Siccirubricoccus deserti]
MTASSEVLPVVREYERSMATVLNAAVMPAVATYVGRLEQRLEAGGIAAPLLLMKSNGGVAGATAIRRAPLQTALSGPAAGVVGAAAMARAAGVPDIITVDIGGTSADICLIREGKVGLTQSGRVGPGRCRCRWWTWSPSAPAAARLPGSPAARWRWGRRAPGRIPARPATAAVAPARR